MPPPAAVLAEAAIIGDVVLPHAKKKRGRPVGSKEVPVPVTLKPQRRRTQTSRYSEDEYSNEQEGYSNEQVQQARANSRVDEYSNEQVRLMQQARANSRVVQFHAPVNAYTVPEAPTYRPTVAQFADPLAYIETIREEAQKFQAPVNAYTVPEAPTYRPTAAQFADPLAYIETIREEAQKYGIAKIIPPQGWSPPPPRPVEGKRFPTKEQAIHTLSQGLDYEDGKDYTIAGKRSPTKELVMHTLSQGLDYEDGKDYTIADTQGLEYEDGKDYTITKFKAMAHKFAADWSAKHGLSAAAAAAAAAPADTIPAAAAAAPAAAAAAAAAAPQNSGSAPARLPTPAEIAHMELEYWRMVDVGEPRATVEYGNDIDVNEFWSGFPAPPPQHMVAAAGEWAGRALDFAHKDYYAKSGWNLCNLPFWRGSVLRWFRHKITGVNVPWLYIGMQFTTFAWHNEDNYLYSINYNHEGAPKIWYGVPGVQARSFETAVRGHLHLHWYGVPGSQARRFETAVRGHLHLTMEDDPELLYNITTMVTPALLREAKVSVSRACQDAGTFVVTFPKAYHGGFSTGYNMGEGMCVVVAFPKAYHGGFTAGYNTGEAVNFAMPDWVKFGHESNERYRLSSRASVFSYDRMAFMLAMYLPEHTLQSCKAVLTEVRRLRDEELNLRAVLANDGVVDPGAGVRLHKFRLSVFDEISAQHDDRRMCHVCKHTCFMSAVVCACSQTRVACLRHWRGICDAGAPGPHRAFFLLWLSADELNGMVDITERYVASLERGAPMPPAELHRFWGQFDPEGECMRRGGGGTAPARACGRLAAAALAQCGTPLLLLLLRGARVRTSKGAGAGRSSTVGRLLSNAAADRVWNRSVGVTRSSAERCRNGARAWRGRRPGRQQDERTP
ncbi:hypothetical protein JKP88DRAFT_348135 [Tribonema minus]|uniref:Uncharacterized protein n=1 Tax=Tribonema minus TaxID=303371 RepID=A0A835Z4N8_9STRA|nr:hypothetical protein JKP88DRAFT_348135 [Tribonema minus]